MKTETKSRISFYTLVVVIGIVLVLCIGVALQIITDEKFKRAKEKTLNEINDIYASDDYKQGWIDALERIDAWYHAGTNATLIII